MQNGQTPHRSRSRQQQTPERVMRTASTMQQGNSRPEGVPPQGARPPQGNTGAYPYPGYAQEPQMIRNSYTGSNGYVVPREMRTPPPKPPKKKHTARNLILILLVLAITGGIAYAAKLNADKRAIQNYVASYDSVYLPGITVDGINIGGMSAQAGYDAVVAQAQARNNAWSVALTYNGQTLSTVTAGQLGMTVDVADVLTSAWALGHTGDTETRYAEIEKIRSEGWSAYTALPGGDTSVLDSVLTQVKACIDTPAVEAEMLSFDPSLSYPFTFREEQQGLTLDIEPIKTKLYEMVSTMTGGSIELQPNVIEPEVTVASLKEKLAIRASVYTPISKDSTDNRNNNIRRCFELLSGKIVRPGKRLSFNTVVGKRTMANGFYEAIEYAYGEHVMGIGGGTCQASTTLYQACVLAGLQIVDRSPHSDSVSYAAYGTDATVYWEGKRNIDFVFKNTTDSPIYIVAAVETDPTNNKRLIARCTLYGESLGDTRYELYAEEIEELPIPETPTYRKDTNATYVTYTDEEKLVSKGKVGHVVVSYRITYQNDVEVNRTQLFKDTYNAQPVVYYVGVTKRETTK